MFEELIGEMMPNLMLDVMLEVAEKLPPLTDYDLAQMAAVGGRSLGSAHLDGAHGCRSPGRAPVG